ncbi:class I SAM-dependent methyltransferase [Desulfitobacterium sp. THU1]|uniref:class I SAM-dependent methyltransferase n=1 Tax=Desulfitobacterium sp. THU1 TaxID=3138072 RepID=UPI00311FFC0E
MIGSTVILNLTHPKDPHLLKQSAWFSEQPGITILPSEKRYSRPRDRELYPTLHITRKGTFLEAGEHRIMFHPSMALLRVIQILRGEPDRFLKAVNLQEGDTFLDATLGLGTDALVAAFRVGARGQVIGIEHSAILSALVQDGLTSLAQGNYPQADNPDKNRAWLALSEAAQHIQVQWGDHQELLTQFLSSSVDVVYFDPMFRHTRDKSDSIRPLHQVSNPQALSQEAVAEAYRVARKRVILKERKESPEFARLGFSVDEGGKYSHVDYGMIRKEGAGD